MSDPTAKALALDLGCLTPEDIVWLHQLKQKATVLQARIMLKHMKEEGVEP